MDRPGVGASTIASRGLGTDAQATGPVLEPGAVVGGYVVEELAGAGGMGVVYRATDRELGRLVALKLIAPRRAGDARFRELFVRESLIAAGLEHPNVIPIYRAGEDEGRLYIAMRYVEGASLQELIGERGRVPPGRAARVVARVAEALDAAHARGLVHRDVKPANVLIADPDGDEHVYLTDFGLSAGMSAGGDGPQGGWAGTLAYLAPEQIRGGAVDARTDVYALGCVLFNALSGRPPFATGDEAAALEAHLTQAPPRLADVAPGLPPALDEVVRRAMAKRPEDRFASAGELGRAALAARYDVAVLRAEADAGAAREIAARLAEAGLQPFVAEGATPREAAEGVGASSGCVVLVGRDGLGEWAREGLAAATQIGGRDRAFRTALVLLPGGPEPVDPSLAFLANDPWIDLRAGVADPDGVGDLVRVLRGADVGPGIVAAATEACPYRGLESFREDDAELFFGREEDVARLVERLRTTRFLAVLGPSGSGKSSLVAAGLIPAVRRGALPGGEWWRVLRRAPGPRPLAALAARLGHLPGSGSPAGADLAGDERGLDLAVARALEGGPATARVLLVVDQLEEAFTLCQDDGERAAFLGNLMYAATIPGGRAVIVAAMRADFYGRLAEHPELRSLAAAQQVLLGPMDARGLRRAIEQPAARAGLELEPGLTRRILTDVADRPGTLPLMEHLLVEVWQRRRGRTLTLEAYAASGGVEGALARRANAIYGGMTPERQAVARRVLLRLTQPGEGTEDTRRRATRRELITRPGEEAEVDAVIASLAEARLLTTGSDPASGEPVVDVTHEALIRGWPELRGWINDDREQLRLHRRVSDAAADWDAGGRDDGQLYRGAPLAVWEGRDESHLNELEHGFLAASRGRVERERAARRKRTRITIGALAGVAAVIAGIAVFAFVQRNNAADERDVAQSRAIAAGAREELARDPQLSLLLASEAYDRAPTVEAEEVLRRATLESRVRRVLQGHDGAVNHAAYSPDATRLVTGGDDGTIRVWTVATGGDPLVIEAGEAVNAVVFSPDGRSVVSAQASGAVRAWTLSTGEAQTLASHDGPALSVDVGETGGRVVSGGEDGTVRVTSLTGAPTRVLRGVRGRVDDASVSADGTLVAAGGIDDPALYLWDLRRGGAPERLQVESRGIADVDIAPDGSRVLGAADIGLVFVWPVPASGRPLTLNGHVTSVRGASFSADGDEVVSAGLDGLVRVWDLTLPDRARAPVAVVRGHGGPVNTAAFSQGGQQVLSASEDATARVWDWRGGVLSSVGLPIRAESVPLGPPAFSEDGGSVFRALGDGGVLAWNPQTGALREAVASEGGPIFSAVIAPDGPGVVAGGVGAVSVRALRVAGQVLTRSLPAGEAVVLGLALNRSEGLLAAGSEDGVVRVWDLGRGGDPVKFTSDEKVSIAVAISPDGTRVASGGDSGAVVLWERDAPGAGRVIQRQRGPVFDVVFSPDGQRVASASQSGAVDVTDLASGATTRLRGYRRGVTGASFSPDGRLLATAAEDGVRVWDWARSRAVLRIDRPSGEFFVAFSPSGDRFATLGADSKLKVWSCDVCGPVREVRELAGRRAQRELTAEEREQFNLGDGP